MPNFCVAPNCTKKSTQTDLAFFRFPRDVKRCHEWVENCRRADLLAKTPDQLNKHYRLCAAHFDPSMICKTGPFRTVLKDNAVPTIFDFSGQNKKLHKNRKRVKVLTEEEVRDIKERRLEEEAEANREDEDVDEMEQDNVPQLSQEEREYREYLRSLFEILLLLGKQGIPLIGHMVNAPLSSATEPVKNAAAVDGNQEKTDTNSNGNRTGATTTFTPLSNFQALVEFRISAGDEALRRRFEGAATNSETCPPETLLNMMEVAGSSIREDILRDVQLFSLIAGEPVEMSSDLASGGDGGRNVLLPIFTRFVDASAVPEGQGPREELLGFVSLEGDGEALADGLLAYVTDTCGLDMDKCRGFAYDCGGGGARHALRMRTAAERISGRHPAVVRTLWSGCGLNTLLAESAGTPGTQVVVATLGRLDALFRSSPPLRLELERTVATSFRDDEVMAQELLVACRKGCWSRRHDAFQLISDLLESLKLCLEAVCDSSHDQRWSERVVRDSLALAETLNDFEFLAALVVLKNVLSFTRAFGRNLQGGAMDVHLATSSVTAVLHSLVEVADNIDVYHEFWFEEAVLVAQSLGIPVRVPLRHLRKCAGAEPQPESYYKEHLTVPVVNYVISELTELFSETHLKVLRCLSLVPAVMGQLKFAADVAEETAVAEVYRSDLPSPDTLATELQCWRVKWKHRSKGVPLPGSIAETLSLSDVKFFPNLDALLGALWNLPLLNPMEQQPKTQKPQTPSSQQQQQQPEEQTTAIEETQTAEKEVASSDADNDDGENADDAGDDAGAHGGCGGSARNRLQAYLRDTPVRHRCQRLALIYASMDARHDPDRMVESYLKLYPDVN